MAGAGEYMRVKDGFAIPGEAPGDPSRSYNPDMIIGPDDPIGVSHAAFMEPIAGKAETTAEPGTRRFLGLRLPSRVTVEQATEHNTGHAHETGEALNALRRSQSEGEDNMVHQFPPDDPRSPASTFAPAQPAAGVVADDVPPEQNPAGGPRASEVAAEDVDADKFNARAVLEHEADQRGADESGRTEGGEKVTVSPAGADPNAEPVDLSEEEQRQQGSAEPVGQDQKSGSGSSDSSSKSTAKKSASSKDK